MTADNGDVGALAAEIASIIEGATNTHAELRRAAHDLEEASTKFGKVSKGTNRKDAQAVAPAWREQVKELREAAAEVEAGIKELTGYLTTLRGEGSGALPEPAKTGEELLERDAPVGRRASRRLFDRATEKVDSVSDASEKVTSFVRTGIKIEHPDFRPPSQTETSTGTQAVDHTESPAHHGLQPTDVVSNLIVSSVALIKGVQYLRQRHQERHSREQ